jgi:hypothetical protein
MHARIGDALGHHRDVGFVAQQAFQHDGGIVDRQGEGEAAGALPERRHDGHDVVSGIGRDPEMPARQGALALQQRLRLVLYGEQPGRDAVELAAGLGRGDDAAAAVEQAHAVALLQRRHLAREVGLAEARGAGGSGEGARLGNEMEGAELGRSHICETYR